ncbi:ABC transporter permease [Undibacterium sp. Jales W-56]|uniref:PhnE/PtxC family ABC transporter permease n=1 Tax=Undibacterium sp. Jales W-56 TaxID=2897325 RepID=UPI0021D10B05|nr:ABC transporter permease [Undibacterium sp. Jales W-56]MCU6435508.1 ABC transporter permease [Undibacterium sp. Jales W-56]
MPAHDPAWRSRLTFALLGLLLCWPILVATEFKPWLLADAQSLSATGRFLSGFFPPAHSAEFLSMVLAASWQTVAMATAGMTLALVCAIPMTLIVTGHLSISRIGTGRMRLLATVIRHMVRWLLVLLRSVPELVWALLFVRIVGLGPTAGVCAIALTYCGMLGKVYAEILEAGDAHASDTLLQNGASRLSAFFYGALPNAAAELMSYTVYRWECAIRGSVVMGFVGAGGLGQSMDESMKMLSGAEVSTMLIVFVLLVAIADAVSKLFRERLE